MLAWLARLQTLEELVRHPSLVLLDVIVQDEYTHDVIAQVGDRFAVFDST